MIRVIRSTLVFLARAIFVLVNFFFAFLFNVGLIASRYTNSGIHYRFWGGAVKERIDGQTTTVLHTTSTDSQQVRMSFVTNNELTWYRAVTFSTKEPEILEWIETYGSYGSFWDVGANVGLYSVYYGCLWESDIYCFEPSVFNLPVLVKNLDINGLSNRANVVPMALTDKTKILPFKTSSLVEGAATNAFGVDFTYDGSQFDAVFSYMFTGMRGNDVAQIYLNKNFPGLIKIDVDGIEHLVLDGMKEVLAAPGKRTVFIEVNSDFLEQKNTVHSLLVEMDYSLVRSAQSELVAQSERAKGTFNEIWIKN